MKFIIPYTETDLQNDTSTTDECLLNINENEGTNDQDKETNETPHYGSSSNSVSIQSSSESHCSSPIPQDNAEPKRKLQEIFNDNLKSNVCKDKNDETKSNKMFLLSLLPDVDNMSQRQIRIFKKKVIELIDNIMEEYI